jgi:hypothetical protein
VRTELVVIMRIDSVLAKFSIHQKSLIVEVNGTGYDISDRIPKGVWNKGGLYKHPKIDWYIRKRLCKVTRDFLKELDPTFNVSKIIF